MTTARPAASVRSCLPSAPAPTARFEQRAWRSGAAVVAGADEAGRGAWAGPLVAAAAIWPREAAERRRLTSALRGAGAELRDSKQLSHAQRVLARDIALDAGVRTAIAIICVEELDELGLGTANRLALVRALAALEPEPDHALIDAFRLPEAGCRCEAIIRGDQLCLSIALASIVAKTARDALMVELEELYPGYGFAAHKGYGTRAHVLALTELGPCVAHRRSFTPVAQALTDVDA